MAELVDALVSGTSDESRGGSSPLQGTKSLIQDLHICPLLFKKAAGMRLFY
jgi:hypothetical protein